MMRSLPSSAGAARRTAALPRAATARFIGREIVSKIPATRPQAKHTRSQDHRQQPRMRHLAFVLWTGCGVRYQTNGEIATKKLPHSREMLPPERSAATLGRLGGQWARTPS